MKRTDPFEKLNTALSKATPDVLDQILSQCEDKKGRVITMKPRRQMNKWLATAGSVAAALVLVVGGTFGYAGYRNSTTVDSTISFDVNPSVELNINQKEKVLSATAINADAEKILDGMDLKGTNLDVAVNALIGSMLKNGYLTELQNSILVTVDNADMQKSEELQKKLLEEINSILSATAVSPAVLTQSNVQNTELQELARQNNITIGKANLINDILAKDSLHTFEELAALSVNELNLLANAKNATLNNINSTGTASDKAYIGKDAALDKALNHAGVLLGNIFDLSIELEYDNGKMVYEVDFKSGGYEYEYDIDALTGAVVKFEKERGDITANAPTTGTENGNYIGLDAAKTIALNKAHITTSDITDYKAWFELDDGKAQYEIKFRVGTTEFDITIDAVTGAVLQFEQEAKNQKGNQSSPNANSNATTNNTNTNYIGKDKAKTLALNKAGVTVSATTNYKCEFEIDDGRAEYEIEFYAGTTEYDITIDAVNGTILAYKTDVKNKTNNGNNTNNAATNYIGTDKAKSIAFDKAGVSAGNVYDLEVELDKDNGKVKYEVSFKSGNTEYDVDIDAISGAVLKFEKEIDD